MKHVIVILDLGTTNIKASAIDETGQTVSVKTLSTPVLYGQDSMELVVYRLWQTVLDCFRGAVRDMGCGVHVDAVALSSMAASFVPLDGAGRVLCPAMGWADARSNVYVERHMQEFLAGRQIAGCGQYPLPMYAGFKLQWLRERRPDIYRATRRWLNVSEWIYSLLTGGGEDGYVTDYSIASRTMLFDVANRSWNAAALDYFQVNRDWLPRPLPAGTVVGTAHRATWEAGLSADTKIVLGGHDHMCALAGTGITQPGIVLNSTGTSEAVECLVESDREPEQMAARWMNLECSVLPKQAAAVYYVGASGRVYQSACECLGSYESIDYPMPRSQPIFLPPQRAQLPSVKGRLEGLSPVFDGEQLARTIRDGMYFECRRGIQRILGVQNTKGVVIRCVGGHTKNRFEMQLKSDATGCIIELSPKEDMASKGALALAGVGCGWFGALPDTSRWLYKRGEKAYLEPNPERSQRYEEIYQSSYLTQFAHGVNSL